MRRWFHRAWSDLLCGIGCHDWRNMDGVCRECGWHDPFWSNLR